MPSSSPIPTLPTVARSAPKADDDNATSKPRQPPGLVMSPATSSIAPAASRATGTTGHAPAAVAGNPFSRFMSRIEFKSPAFDFGRHKQDAKKRGSFTLTGVPLLEAEDKEGRENGSTVIGVTSSGERVHSREDEFGVSATVQWSSPTVGHAAGRSSIDTMARMEGEGEDASHDDGDGDEEEEEDDDDIFTHGETLSYQLTFGSGPLGFTVADTRAGKGVFVQDFAKVQTRSGPVATAAELSGHIRVGDVITHVGAVDVQCSSSDHVRDLLDKSPRPVTISFERCAQRYSFEDVTKDPRKVPFYFEFLFGETANPRHEQAKVMFLIESEQFKSQFKNLTPPDRTKEGRRIYAKFFDDRSQFDVSTCIAADVHDAMAAGCGPNAAGEVPADAFDAARILIHDDILHGSFPLFRKSKAYHKMIGYLARSPEFVPLEPSEVLENDDMLQYFMLFLMSTRKHAALRCYLDMDRFVKPKAQQLEGLLKRGLVDSDEAKQTVKELLQAALRVFSLYLCNGSYMEVTLRPLTRLNHWLRTMLNSRADIARIQRRACKLATTKAVETQILGSQLLWEAHKHEQDALFALSVPEALGIGHEVLEAQRSLLRELASDIFPRFQSHPLYEALCEEVGSDWRMRRAKHKPLLLRPGSTKKLLRKVKLPPEFAVHRTARPGAASPLTQGVTSSPSSLPSLPGGLANAKAPVPRPEVDSPADWVMVFDTEFSDHMAIKVRTTRQIPVSEHAKALGKSSPLPPGIENFMVPEEFPTKLGTVPPEPVLFNFLVPGRNEKPFYGACLILYRPANEAMPIEEEDYELGGAPRRDDEPSTPVLNVDLTATQSFKEAEDDEVGSGEGGDEGLPARGDAEGATPPTEPAAADGATAASGRASAAALPAAAAVTRRASLGASIPQELRDQEQEQEEEQQQQQEPPRIMRALSLYKVERGGEGQEHVKAMADKIFSSPRRRAPPAAQDLLLSPTPRPILGIVDEGGGEGAEEGPEPEGPTQEASIGSPAPAVGTGGWAAIATTAGGGDEENGDGGEEEQEEDDDSIIALVEADFQEALLQSYETFAQSTRADEGVLPPPVAAASPRQPGRRPHEEEKVSAFFEPSPPPAFRQSCSSLSTPPRRFSMADHPPQRLLRRGSTSLAFGRDALMAATAKALPVTLTYAPYGFCLISRFAFINSLRAPLAALFDQKQQQGLARAPSALRAVKDFLKAQPPVRVPLSAVDTKESLYLQPPGAPPHAAVPSPGTPAHPHAPLHQQIDFELEILFRSLSPRNLVLVFLAMLLECKVLLISERLTMLTIAGEGLRLLLHPLKWCHLYVPLVPEVMVDRLVGCPTPFIMGLHRKTYLLRRDDFPNDIVLVDLDNDFVQAPAKDLNRKTVPFAGPLARRLERVLNPSTAMSDSYRWRLPAAGSAGDRHPQDEHHRFPWPPFGSPTSTGSHASTASSCSSGPIAAPSSGVVDRRHAPWPPLRTPDTCAALLVLRDFIQGLLTGVQDSCYHIYTEAEVTILFDETHFGHIIGPAELLVITPHDAETDLLPHSPHLLPPPADYPAGHEGFVLRFSRTQAFSTALVAMLHR